MSDATLARPYARAAFNVALADDNLAGWAQALDCCAKVTQDPQFRRLLGAPSLTKPDVVKLVCSAVAKLKVKVPAQALHNLVVQVVNHRRVLIMPAIAELFQAFALDHQGAKLAKVTSAHALTAAQKKKVDTFLQEKFACELVIEWVTDADLLGGFRAQVGDKVFDFSIEQACQTCEKLLTISE